MGSSFPTNGAPQNGQAGRRAAEGRHWFSEQSDEVTLRELVGMLWEGKWMIVATALAVLAGAAAYTYFQTPIYQTSSVVLADRSEQSIPGIPSFTQEGLSNTTGPVGSEVLVINRSKEIRQNVARRLDTMATNPYTGGVPRIVFDENGNRRSVPEIEAALRRVVGAQTIQSQGGRSRDYWGRSSGGIKISITSPFPGEAALLANQFAKAYVTWTRREAQKSARSVRKLLEKQAKKFRARVQRTEQKLETFMQEQGGVELDKRTDRVVEDLANLRSQREELKIELDMKKAKLKSIEEELARIRPKLADRLASGVRSELARVQKEKAEVKAELDQARRRNPDLGSSGDPKADALARLEEKKARLEREADSLASAYVDETLATNGIRSVSADPENRSGRGGRGVTYVAAKQRQLAERRIEISGLEARLRTIEDRISEYQRKLNELPVRQIQLAQIQRDRRAAEDIYGFVRENLQETRIAEQSEVAYAELLEPAGIPLEPISPNTRLNLVLGMFLGLLGGIGLVFVREALDTHIRTPEDLEELCGRVLGVIPSMNPLLEAEFDGDEVEIEGQSLRSTAVMLTAPQSSAAEAYRQLQVNLRYARPDASTRSLIVTSPERGDGKSTTSLNLAIAAARSGETVALVDADLRNPQLHCLLDVSSTPGLPEALYDDATFVTPDVDDLIFLPSGDTCPNPSELLGSQRMGRLVTSLVEEVDLVVIDTPPVLPFSDPTALMPHTDGALLVASANETNRRAFERAHSKLDSVGPRVIGGILNRFDPESGTYGYYKYYDYYEYYDHVDGRENGSEASWLTEVMPTREQR